MDLKSAATSVNGLLRRLDDELLPPIPTARSAASSPTIADTPSLSREATRSPVEGSGLTGFLLLRVLLRDLQEAVAADFVGSVAEGGCSAPNARWKPAELRAQLAAYATCAAMSASHANLGAEPNEAVKTAPTLNTLPTSLLLHRIAALVVDMLELVSPSEQDEAPSPHDASSNAASSPTAVLYMEDFDSLQGAAEPFFVAELEQQQQEPPPSYKINDSPAGVTTCGEPGCSERKEAVEAVCRSGKRRRDGLDAEASHHRKKTTIHRQFRRHASAMDATLTAVSARLYSSMTERDTLFPLQSLAFALCQPIVRVLSQQIDRCTDTKCKRMFADFAEEVHERHDIDFFGMDSTRPPVDESMMLDPYGTAESSPTNRTASDKGVDELHGRGCFCRSANRSNTTSISVGGRPHQSVVSSMPSDSFVKELSNSIPMGGMFDPLGSDTENSYLSIPPPLLSVPSSRQTTTAGAGAFTTAHARLSPESSISSAARPMARDSLQLSPPRSPTAAAVGCFSVNRSAALPSGDNSPTCASSPQVFPARHGACATSTHSAVLSAKASSTVPRRLGSVGQKTPATQVKKAGELPAYMLTKKRCPPGGVSVPPPPPAKQRSCGGAPPSSVSSSVHVPVTHQVLIREAWQRSSGLTDSTYRLPTAEQVESNAPTLPRLILSNVSATPPMKPALSSPTLLADGLRQDRILFCDDDD